MNSIGGDLDKVLNDYIHVFDKGKALTSPDNYRMAIERSRQLRNHIIKNADLRTLKGAIRKSNGPGYAILLIYVWMDVYCAGSIYSKGKNIFDYFRMISLKKICKRKTINGDLYGK